MYPLYNNNEKRRKIIKSGCFVVPTWCQSSKASIRSALPAPWFGMTGQIQETQPGPWWLNLRFFFRTDRHLSALRGYLGAGSASSPTKAPGILSAQEK
jgi:hypothetical protein